MKTKSVASSLEFNEEGALRISSPEEYIDIRTHHCGWCDKPFYYLPQEEGKQWQHKCGCGHYTTIRFKHEEG